MDAQAIAEQVATAVKAAPAKAQDLVRDPAGAIEAITGQTGFDVTEVVQASVLKLAEKGADLSGVDFSQLDVSKLDLSKLDLAALANAADSLGVDLSKLGLGGGLSGIAGMLGGLFGKR